MAKVSYDTPAAMRKHSPFEIMAARARDVFTKNRIDPEVKLLAAPAPTIWDYPYRRASLTNGTLPGRFSHGISRAVVPEDWLHPSTAGEDSQVDYCSR
jgi:hypothetical protein